jgi:hypothetical protein
MQVDKENNQQSQEATHKRPNGCRSPWRRRGATHQEAIRERILGLNLLQPRALLSLLGSERLSEVNAADCSGCGARRAGAAPRGSCSALRRGSRAHRGRSLVHRLRRIHGTPEPEEITPTQYGFQQSRALYLAVGGEIHPASSRSSPARREAQAVGSAEIARLPTTSRWRQRFPTKESYRRWVCVAVRGRSARLPPQAPAARRAR